MIIDRGDVWMIQDGRGGEINEEGGYIEMTDGLHTLVVLALGGGNMDDTGAPATEALQWWGNEGEPPERQYRSEFHSTVMGAPVTSARLVVIRDAAQRDIDRDLVATRAIKSAEVFARIVRPKTIGLRIDMLLNDGRSVNISKEVTQ